MQRFMHYVSKTRREAEEEEARREALVDKEVEEKWKEKDARMKVEKQARQTLLNNVLTTREEQMRERGESSLSSNQGFLSL